MTETAQDRANQCNDILRHIRKHGSINPMVALNKYGCMRLAARVCDLRKQGFPIESFRWSRKTGEGRRSGIQSIGW